MSERIPGEGYPDANFAIDPGEVRVKLLEGDVVAHLGPDEKVLIRVGQYWALGKEQAEAHAAVGEFEIVKGPAHGRSPDPSPPIPTPSPSPDRVPSESA